MGSVREEKGFSDQSFDLSSTGRQSSWFIWWSNTGGMVARVGAQVGGWQTAEMAAQHRWSIQTGTYMGTGWQKPAVISH